MMRAMLVRSHRLSCTSLARVPRLVSSIPAGSRMRKSMPPCDTLATCPSRSSYVMPQARGMTSTTNASKMRMTPSSPWSSPSAIVDSKGLGRVDSSAATPSGNLERAAIHLALFSGDTLTRMSMSPV